MWTKCTECLWDTVLAPLAINTSPHSSRASSTLHNVWDFFRWRETWGMYRTRGPRMCRYPVWNTCCKCWLTIHPQKSWPAAPKCPWWWADITSISILYRPSPQPLKKVAVCMCGRTHTMLSYHCSECILELSRWVRLDCYAGKIATHT